MFRKTSAPARTVTITFDGNPLTVDAETTVATALLGVGITVLRRSVVGNEPRTPFCLMGVCFECLVTVDGIQNRQACMVPVREGMEVCTQMGARDLGEEPAGEAARRAADSSERTAS
ncbi:(2Fe-2S)-binding protein [Brucella intermedia]|uniref:(2Fe-2S)-binding protein n=1 Tax=Brucella intermedia TaxID=94625 RepID=UPI0022497EC0|nr:(2Fe-2S)-binding protein [Brucella intermedia]